MPGSVYSKLVDEFKRLWPKLTVDWLSFRKTKGTMETFGGSLISNHLPIIPNLTDLLIILLSISPTTAALERSYSKLAKICYKDRNSILTKNLETDYLLAVLGIQGESILYETARSILQKKVTLL